MNLNKGIPVEFGSLRGMVFGGPFRQFEEGTRRLVGVKMAEEINHPHHISIPTEDFSIPDTNDMVSGVMQALTYLAEGNDIYAGCMGGIGRTGLFMGCMKKLMNDWAIHKGLEVAVPLDPVAYVRKHYKPHAIETEQQQTFVRSFPTESCIALLDELIGPKVVEREVSVEVPTPYFPPLFEYMAWWLSGGFLR